MFIDQCLEDPSLYLTGHCSHFNVIVIRKLPAKNTHFQGTAEGHGARSSGRRFNDLREARLPARSHRPVSLAQPPAPAVRRAPRTAPWCRRPKAGDGVVQASPGGTVVLHTKPRRHVATERTSGTAGAEQTSCPGARGRDVHTQAQGRAGGFP